VKKNLYFKKHDRKPRESVGEKLAGRKVGWLGNTGEVWEKIEGWDRVPKKGEGKREKNEIRISS